MARDLATLFRRVATLDALAAAVEAQRGLTEESWPEPVVLRVRMGLHTGTADERGGDYFGPPVNRAARLMTAGYGGQVLVSLATMGALVSARSFRRNASDPGAFDVRLIEAERSAPLRAAEGRSFRRAGHERVTKSWSVLD